MYIIKAALIDLKELDAYIRKVPLFANLFSSISGALSDSINITLQNYLGPALSGAPFHLHVRSCSARDTVLNIHFIYTLLCNRVPQ